MPDQGHAMTLIAMLSNNPISGASGGVLRRAADWMDAWSPYSYVMLALGFTPVVCRFIVLAYLLTAEPYEADSDNPLGSKTQELHDGVV